MSRSTSPKRGHGRREHNPKEMCPVNRKIRHASRKKALNVLNQLRGTRVARHRKLASLPEQVYKCEHCGGWHLTSQVPR